MVFQFGKNMQILNRSRNHLTYKVKSLGPLTLHYLCVFLWGYGILSTCILDIFSIQILKNIFKMPPIVEETQTCLESLTDVFGNSDIPSLTNRVWYSSGLHILYNSFSISIFQLLYKKDESFHKYKINLVVFSRIRTRAPWDPDASSLPTVP